MNLPNFIFRLLSASFCIFCLFPACKKDERNSAEWGELATAKRNEIQALTQNIPCSRKSSVIVKEISEGCSVQYFAIQDSDLAKYEKLKKEYLDFTSKQYAALHREGVIVDPCFESIWAVEQPIRLDCKGDKVQLITSVNVGLDEARALVDGNYELITGFVNAQTCTENINWAYTPLINYKTMKIEVIPYSRTADYTALKEKVSLHNRLSFRIVEAQGAVPNFQHGKTVDKVECLNGKPVIKFKN